VPGGRYGADVTPAEDARDSEDPEELGGAEDPEDAALARSIGIAMPFGLLAGVVFGILIDNLAVGIAMGLPAGVAAGALLHHRNYAGSDPPPAS
jgi:hypothetical protein